MEDLLSILLGTIFNPIYIIIVVVVILLVVFNPSSNVKLLGASRKVIYLVPILWRLLPIKMHPPHQRRRRQNQKIR